MQDTQNQLKARDTKDNKAYEGFPSDHAIVIYKEGDDTILSWNTLGKCSKFADGEYDNPQRAVESWEEYENRVLKDGGVLDVLLKRMEKEDVGLAALQEAGFLQEDTDPKSQEFREKCEARIRAAGYEILKSDVLLGKSPEDRKQETIDVIKKNPLCALKRATDLDKDKKVLSDPKNEKYFIPDNKGKINLNNPVEVVSKKEAKHIVEKCDYLGAEGRGCAILYKKNKYTPKPVKNNIIMTQAAGLHYYVECESLCASADDRIWAKLRNNKTNEVTTLVSVHMDYRKTHVGPNQGRAKKEGLTSFVQKSVEKIGKNERIIMAGDWNTPCPQDDQSHFFGSDKCTNVSHEYDSGALVFTDAAFNAPKSYDFFYRHDDSKPTFNACVKIDTFEEQGADAIRKEHPREYSLRSDFSALDRINADKELLPTTTRLIDKVVANGHLKELIIRAIQHGNLTLLNYATSLPAYQTIPTEGLGDIKDALLGHPIWYQVYCAILLDDQAFIDAKFKEGGAELAQQIIDEAARIGDYSTIAICMGRDLGNSLQRAAELAAYNGDFETLRFCKNTQGRKLDWAKIESSALMGTQYDVIVWISYESNDAAYDAPEKQKELKRYNEMGKLLDLTEQDIAEIKKLVVRNEQNLVYLLSKAIQTCNNDAMAHLFEHYNNQIKTLLQQPANIGHIKKALKKIQISRFAAYFGFEDFVQGYFNPYYNVEETAKIAAKYDHLNILKFADQNKDDGTDAFQWDELAKDAMSNGHTDVLEHCISKGAKISDAIDAFFVNLSNPFARKILDFFYSQNYITLPNVAIRAASCGSIDAVVWSFEKDTTHSILPQNIAHMATQNSQLEVLKYVCANHLYKLDIASLKATLPMPDHKKDMLDVLDTCQRFKNFRFTFVIPALLATATAVTATCLSIEFVLPMLAVTLIAAVVFGAMYNQRKKDFEKVCGSNEEGVPKLGE